MGAISIFCIHLIALNDKLCRIAARIIPMGQTIGNHFSQYAIPDADTDNPFQNEIIIQMLLPKSQHSIIRIKQISNYYFPIVISVQVINPEYSIRLMLR